MAGTISPQELVHRQRAGDTVVLIDVRTPVEFRELHADFARNVPLDRLNPGDLTNIGAGQERPLFVVCRSGARGRQACDRLIAAGFDATNVAGGMLAWDAAGLPVVRGARAISLERQVRIVAGALVLLSATLGLVVHPYWIGLAAFIGAGLVFAGITDTCGMGLLLARMPWNQIGIADLPTEPAGPCETTESCCAVQRK